MQFGPYTFESDRLEKALFPADDLTKGDLLDYYIRVAEWLLPHARDRPLAMHRFPDGIEEKGFYQKNVPDYFPDWIHTTRVGREEGSIRMLLPNNQATLAYLANQACIELHLFPSKAQRIRQPDKMIFDLDPPDGRFDGVVKAARALRQQLENEMGLRTFLMTTGSRGLHVVAPLRPGPDFDQVREVAHRACDTLAARYPGDFTTEMRKKKRENRIFLDYLRNAYGQHSIAPYSLRALPSAPVATPIQWDELDQLPREARSFTIRNVLDRLEEQGDPWKGMYRYGRRLQKK